MRHETPDTRHQTRNTRHETPDKTNGTPDKTNGTRATEHDELFTDLFTLNLVLFFHDAQATTKVKWARDDGASFTVNFL